MNSQLKAKIFAPYCYVAKYYRVKSGTFGRRFNQRRCL